MRVTGGELRGFSLRTPKGSGTRPMSDRLKLTLFSMLAARDQPRGLVLDLFAGTGALGIEALSRGAEHADFVEQNGDMCGVIRENLVHTRLTPVADVHKQSVSGFLAHPPAKRFDLIFMDPPYADPHIASTVTAVGEAGILSEEGLVVLGHSSRRDFPERLGPLVVTSRRCHGDSCISFYIWDSGPGRGSEAVTDGTG